MRPEDRTHHHASEVLPPGVCCMATFVATKGNFRQGCLCGRRPIQSSVGTAQPRTGKNGTRTRTCTRLVWPLCLVLCGVPFRPSDVRGLSGRRASSRPAQPERQHQSIRRGACAMFLGVFRVPLFFCWGLVFGCVLFGLRVCFGPYQNIPPL